jgi:phenylpropionate dioxygenase-like ring-hydroxylating dioxygenase large terminal subunit
MTEPGETDSTTEGGIGSRLKYLWESWYCAGWGADLTDQPSAIKMLDQELVLFRDDLGNACAISNRCSHRFAPLSRGKKVGGLLECPYHGLQFDGSGTCVFNPHGDQIPPRAHVRSYPIVEKHRALWVWMGDPANADPGTIFPLSFLDDDRYAVATGYLHINADYQLLNDNLLDLTHALYIHPQTVGVPVEDLAHVKGAEWDVKSEANVVTTEMTVYGVPATPQYLGLFEEPIGNLRIHVTWQAPSCFALDMSMSPEGSPKPVIDSPRDDSVLIPGAHLIVPETESSCHYFYAQSRSADIFNEDKTREMLALADYTFTQEDAPIIEECFRLMDGNEFFELRPLSLPTDKAGLQARRILKKLIEFQLPAYETRSVPTQSPGRFREAGRSDDATPPQSSGHRRGVRELLAGK